MKSGPSFRFGMRAAFHLIFLLFPDDLYHEVLDCSAELFNNIQHILRQV